jgi:hypothetical protein
MVVSEAPFQVGDVVQGVGLSICVGRLATVTECYRAGDDWWVLYESDAQETIGCIASRFVSLVRRAEVVLHGGAQISAGASVRIRRIATALPPLPPSTLAILRRHNGLAQIGALA